MQTMKRKVGNLTVEEPLLDEAGKQKQRDMMEKIHQAYQETGSLKGEKLCEEVAQYEQDIQSHVVD